MNEITLQSKIISIEMLLVDCRTPGRLVEHYERCSAAQRKDYVAALAMALCVSEKRRQLALTSDRRLAQYDVSDSASQDAS